MTLRIDLTKIAKRAPELAEKALIEAANDVFSISQDLCPVDTGALKASGKITIKKDGTSTQAIISYGDDEKVDYAAAVEYGSVRSAAQPFLTPAMAQAKEAFEARLDHKLKEIK